jgi:hypothetical protein
MTRLAHRSSRAEFRMKDRAKRLRGCVDRLADQPALLLTSIVLSSPTPGALVLPRIRVSNARHSTEITLASLAPCSGTLDVSFRALENIAASETAPKGVQRVKSLYITCGLSHWNWNAILLSHCVSVSHELFVIPPFFPFPCAKSWSYFRLGVPQFFQASPE